MSLMFLLGMVAHLCNRFQRPIQISCLLLVALEFSASKSSELIKICPQELPLELPVGTTEPLACYQRDPEREELVWETSASLP